MIVTKRLHLLPREGESKFRVNVPMWRGGRVVARGKKLSFGARGGPCTMHSVFVLSNNGCRALPVSIECVRILKRLMRVTDTGVIWV